MISERLRDLVKSTEMASEVDFDVTQPKVREHGDWSVNVALVLQKEVKKPPREIAQGVVDQLPASDWVDRVEIAGPGFINFFLSPVWMHDECERALKEESRFGSSELGKHVSANVEFVSSNPNGPLTVAHGRNAVLGDSISRLLSFAGYRVTREYYWNDRGLQMQLFGQSVEARYRELLGLESEFPDDGYKGEYINELAEMVRRKYPDPSSAEVVLDTAIEIVMGWIQDTLNRLGVQFDVWFQERDLYERDEVTGVIERLKELGYTYEDDGAVWLRSTEFGDSRDRVLVRSHSGGHPTYLAPDLAYHADKAKRGYAKMIVVLGADHHAQTPSLHAGMEALGVPRDAIEIVLYQFVRMVKGGEPVKMSTRMWTAVALDELLDQVGVDATRYTLLRTSPESTIQFDIDLVASRTMENPVYYVQYAHARIASILRKAGIKTAGSRWNLLIEPAETELMRGIANFELAVRAATEQRAPHRLATFAEEFARLFHSFYTECRVMVDDEELRIARLALVRAAQVVLRNSLQLLGVGAPESMEKT